MCTAQASSSGEPDASQAPLSLEEARRILGIPEGATFEQTVQAKNRLLSKAGKDGEKQTQVQLTQFVMLALALLDLPCSSDKHSPEGKQ